VLEEDPSSLVLRTTVGTLYTLNPVDPWLETACFFHQPLNLSSEHPVSQFLLFKCMQLVPLQLGRVRPREAGEELRVPAVQRAGRGAHVQPRPRANDGRGASLPTPGRHSHSRVSLPLPGVTRLVIWITYWVSSIRPCCDCRVVTPGCHSIGFIWIIPAVIN
jgi:hypothetical protein